MLQARELVPLMDRLLANNYTLMIETSGERPLAALPRARPQDRRRKVSRRWFRSQTPSASKTSTPSPPNDEVKFVLADRADYEFARDFINTPASPSAAEKSSSPPLSPEKSTDQRSTDNAALDPASLVEWMLADGLPARPQPPNPQVHLGAPQKGV